MYRGFVLAAVASGSSPGLRPFAACHPPLSPFPVISEAVLSIKLYKGWKKKWNNAKSLLFLFTPFAFSKRLDKMAVGCCSCVEVFYTVCQVSRCHHKMDVLPPPSRDLPESTRRGMELYSWWQFNLTYVNALGAWHPNSHESLSKCYKVWY